MHQFGYCKVRTINIVKDHPSRNGVDNDFYDDIENTPDIPWGSYKSCERTRPSILSHIEYFGRRPNVNC